ncbi:MAG: SDR family oxidoreductase [Chloroflexi bacterium]|nr:SDR family oxidoreductase [Chloroflexota bacterium]
MLDPGLENKVVLVTGANHGIGAATAHAFAAQGARVFLTYLRLSPEQFGISTEVALAATEKGLPYYHARQMQTADQVVASIREAGGEAAAWEADLTVADNIPTLFDRAEGQFGPVEILVNNAAIYQNDDTITAITPPALATMFDVNAESTVLMTAEYIRRYQQRQAIWGRIINLSTSAAQVFAGQIGYGASKAAVEALTRSIAIEVGPLGITVNAIAPGPTQTDYIDAELEAQLVPDIPLRRLGQPEDIANSIIFLASQQADWLTGTVIKVSGGYNL